MTTTKKILLVMTLVISTLLGIYLGLPGSVRRVQCYQAGVMIFDEYVDYSNGGSPIQDVPYDNRGVVECTTVAIRR